MKYARLAHEHFLRTGRTFFIGDAMADLAEAHIFCKEFDEAKLLFQHLLVSPEYQADLEFIGRCLKKYARLLVIIDDYPAVLEAFSRLSAYP